MLAVRYRRVITCWHIRRKILPYWKSLRCRLCAESLQRNRYRFACASQHASHPAGAPTGLICARLVAKGMIGEYLRSVRMYVVSNLSTLIIWNFLLIKTCSVWNNAHDVCLTFGIFIDWLDGSYKIGGYVRIWLDLIQINAPNYQYRAWCVSHSWDFC